MKRRMTQLLFATILAITFVSVGQAQGISYKAKFGGTVIDIVWQNQPDQVPGTVVRASAKGTFGQSEAAILTEFEPGEDVAGVCPSTDYNYLPVFFSRGVFTYAKGEQLVLSSDRFEGYLCLNLTTGDYEGLLTGEFDGGTGRFADAHGDWETYFSGRNLTYPDGLLPGFGPINGDITGTLYLK